MDDSESNFYFSNENHCKSTFTMFFSVSYIFKAMLSKIILLILSTFHFFYLPKMFLRNFHFFIIIIYFFFLITYIQQSEEKNEKIHPTSTSQRKAFISRL